MKKQVNSETIDQTNPEWTDSMVAETTTLEASALPEVFKGAARRGRPVAAKPKQAISIRLSPDVLEYFRSSGKGWQTRLDDVLRDYVSHTS